MYCATACTKMGISKSNYICWKNVGKESQAWQVVTIIKSEYTSTCTIFAYISVRMYVGHILRLLSSCSDKMHAYLHKIEFMYHHYHCGKSACIISIPAFHRSISTSFWPCVEYPSCLHTTVASVELQPSSHTVPHTLFIQISTLPSFGTLPPTSCSWPVKHGARIRKYCLITCFCMKFQL